MSRRWDAGAYDRVSDPLVRMGNDVLTRLVLRGDETVIDAGCGTGRITEQLLERLPSGRVIALDVSGAMLAAAGVRLAAYGDRVTLLEADLNLPLPVSEPADAILSTATFPAADLPRLAHALADRLHRPVIDYVRLNLVARRG